jgi:hypothetical protein
MNIQNKIFEEIDKTSNFYSFKCPPEEMSKHLPNINPRYSIVCQNIRSIYRNYDDFEINIGKISKNIDILILTECRIDTDKPLPHKPGYVNYNTLKKLTQNDGVVIYVKSSIQHSVNEVCISDATCLKITFDNVSILCIYRSPSHTNTQNFTSSLDSYLANNKHLKNTMLIGDININILEGRTSNSAKHYLDVLAEHGLLPGHRLDTRVNSCLDHVFMNLNPLSYSASVAILETTITDHCLIFVNIYAKIKAHNTRSTKTLTNFEDALKCFQTYDLVGLLDIKDPDTLTNTLLNYITNSLDSNTRTIKISNNKKIMKPWITAGILRCIKNRNELQKKSKCDVNNEILKLTYRRYRNYCNNLIKTLKRQYERDLLNKARSNNKQLWEAIRNVTSLNKNRTKNNELIKLTTSPSDSANIVNNHFLGVGKSLAEQIIPNLNNESTSEYLRSLPTVVNSIAVLKPELHEIESIIMSLKTFSAPGWDRVPISFIKMAKKELVPILAHLCSLCFEQGIFPHSLKRSIIHPVFKSGDRNDISNYRPISVLTGLSKILEKIINNRIIEFINKYNLLSSFQYGFRKSRCTEHAISELVGNIVHNMDNKLKPLCVFLDLKKAFDTVSIPMLVNKLEKKGIRGSFLHLITNYLTDRTQCVKLDEHIVSMVEPVSNYGVPQGSVLGPTLFLIYIDDLTNIELADGKVISYADDTALLFTGHTWEDSFAKAESGLRSVVRWLQLNLLTLNVSKSNYITFSILNNKQPHSRLSLAAHYCRLDTECSCTILSKVSVTRYLGVLIDQSLSWQQQIDSVSSRARKMIWIFKYLRHVADKRLLIYIYKSLVQSVLLYCLRIWGGTHKTKMIGLERTQRAILKVMMMKKRTYRTSDIYHDTSVLTVRKLYILNSILELHKNTNPEQSIINKRKPYSVIKAKLVHTTFARRQSKAQSVNLYNTINRVLNIYTMTSNECKKAIITWFKDKDYNEIENIFVSIP